ncbi:unnamed protein product [Owenia fusiformis]|uniref:Uncharacterized protein n=1 Tax=Owenia fusiformis TaxID=6347 RepID=A0A8J1XV60_OWEFU|nr:unnamed protein product [Owenia fusiformis]
MDVNSNIKKEDGLGSNADVLTLPKTRYRTNNNLLYGIDVLLNCTVFTGLNMLFWTVTTALFDYYIYPTDTYLSNWSSTIGGATCMLILSVSQESLLYRISRDNARVYLIASRLYGYLTACSGILFTRGVTNIYDMYDGTSSESAIYSILIGYIPLLLLGCTRNLVAPPVCSGQDSEKSYFVVEGYFRSSTRQKFNFLLDHIFSIVVVDALVVITWRGISNLAANQISPEDPKLAAFTICYYGYLVILLCFALQYPFFHISTSSQERHLTKLITEDVFVTMSAFASIFLWKGLWEVFNIYIVQGNDVSVLWGLNIGAYLLAAVLNISCGLFEPSVDRDGSYENGDGVLFPIHYLSCPHNKVEKLKEE